MGRRCTGPSHRGLPDYSFIFAGDRIGGHRAAVSASDCVGHRPGFLACHSRLVRAEFRSLREAEFVTAARSQGFSNLRIIFQEMLPNALPPVIVTTSVIVASAILIESGLSFLGMGDPNVASWG